MSSKFPAYIALASLVLVALARMGSRPSQTSTEKLINDSPQATEFTPHAMAAAANRMARPRAFRRRCRLLPGRLS